MMIDDKEIKIKAALAQGKKPRPLSEEYGVAYATVIKYRNQLRDDAEKAKVETITSIDPIALEVIVENIEQENDFKVDLAPVVEGAKGLMALEPKFQSAVEKLLERAVDLADDENLTPNGLNTLSKAVGTLYSDIYSQKGTNVQINNNTNNVSSDSVSAFRELQK